MRVLVDGRLLSERKTGISVYSRKLLEVYARACGAGNVAVILNEDYPSLPFEKVFTRLRPYRLPDFLRFPGFLAGCDFDLYHSPFYSGLSRRIDGKIVCVTAHDLMYRTIEGFFGRGPTYDRLARRYFDFIVGRSIRNADHIFTVSSTSAKDIEAAYGRRSKAIPLWVGVPAALEGAEGPAGLALEKNGFILCVGNQRPHKNIEFLKRCYRRSRMGRKLVLAGGSGGRSEEDGILSLGYVDDGLLDWLYRNAFAFIYPSLYEGFGLPMLEAMARTELILSSNGGNLGTFACPGVHFFDPTDEAGLMTLLEGIDGLERADMRAYAERFSERRFVESYLQAIAGIAREASADA